MDKYVDSIELKKRIMAMICNYETEPDEILAVRYVYVVDALYNVLDVIDEMEEVG